MKTFSQNILKSSVKHVILGMALLIGVTSCTSDPNSPGIEFMPDMYRPQAYEAYLNKYDGDSTKFYDKNIEKISPNFEELDSLEQQQVLVEVTALYNVFTNGSATRKPVAGTVAVGKKPYPLSKDQKAESKALVNPITYSKANMKEGKAYFEIFCDHCHGVKGDGNGPMIQIDVYPAQPPSFMGAAKDLTAGEIYHTIYYGKGVMGSHASQISEDKRWKIVLYVQSLQGKKVEEAPVQVTVKVDSTSVALVD
jgi:mono/diheme cytochrome c family protein